MPYFEVSVDSGRRYCEASSELAAAGQVSGETCEDLGDGRFRHPDRKTIYKVKMITKEKYDRILLPFRAYGGKA